MDWFSFLVVVDIGLAIVAAYHIGIGVGRDRATEKKES